MSRHLAFLVLCCLLLLLPGFSFAALRLENAGVDPVTSWNPRKDADDILLPMPCNLKLALRTVAVPGGVSRDRRFVMGVNNAERERQIYESSFESHIAASFAVQDLPASWLDHLGVSQREGFSYYFLGKYEISQQQWDAVMQALGRDGSENPANCPRSAGSKSNLPVRDISWFEVQDFVQRYNAWLIARSPSALPRYAGTNNIGFLRLPTEEEWEFAARGGIAVREEDRENNDSFLLPGERGEDYGVFLGEHTAVREEPLPIGSRKANPLQLYDTMGNVREMIEGFFRLTIEEIRPDNTQHRRLHGASGGLLCKGGSFRSQLAGVLPGWRDELPLYTSSGVYRARDLGFRVVLAGINIPNASRLHEQRVQGPLVEPSPRKPESRAREANAAGKKPFSSDLTSEPVLTIDQHGDVLTELDRISDATSSSALRANLAQLRNLMARREKAQELQRIEYLESTVRSTLYQAETIRAFAFRYLEANKLLTEQNGQLSPQQKKKVSEVLNNYYQVLLTAANQYKSHLRHLQQMRPEVLSQILAQMRKEYSGTGTLDRHMQENMQTLEKHLSLSRKNGLEQLKNDRLCRDIIPSAHIQQMPHFTH